MATLKVIGVIALLIAGMMGIIWAIYNLPAISQKIRETTELWELATTEDSSTERTRQTYPTRIPDRRHQNVAVNPLTTMTALPTPVRSIPNTKIIQATRTIPTDLDRMENSDWLRSRHSGTYKIIKELPWVKDGLTQNESKAVQDLLYMAANDHETLKRVLDLQWVKDDINGAEAKTTRHLMYLSYRDKTASRNLAEMPFLGSVTEADALLISGLQGRAHRGTLPEFMAHPTVVDGITDDETVLATAVTTIDNQAYMNSLLHPGSAIVETIQTSSPRTPNLNISIVRAGTRRVTDSSVIVEEAVKHVEDTMGMALPTNHMIVLLDDSGVFKGFAGVNYGEAIAYLRSGEDGSDWDRAGFILGMVHEVAHYFWQGNEDWIDEGMATTIEHNFGRSVGFSRELVTTQPKGCTIRTLEELSRANPGRESPQHQCYYYLGEKLFTDLYNELGPDMFRTRAQELLRLSQVIWEEEGDRRAGIEAVVQAFGESSTVVRHWTGRAPTPRATAEPTPLATTPITGTSSVPTIAPTAVTPRTIAPAATATPRPMPTAMSVPTPTSTPIPTPTPTPVPTATPTPEFVTYQEQLWQEVEILLPWRWGVSETDKVKFTSPDGKSYLEIQRHAIPQESGLAEFADQYLTEWLNQVRTWHHYRRISAEGTWVGGNNVVEIVFERQTTSDSCTEEGVTHIHRSWMNPDIGYTITMMVCSEDPAAATPARRMKILASFDETLAE